MASNSIKTPNNGIQTIINDIENVTKEQNSSPKEGIRALNDKERAELERYKSDTNLKKILTIFVICFTSIWSIGILIFLFLFGFNKINCSDGIIIALLTETLATVLGLPLVVTSHFFPKQ